MDKEILSLKNIYRLLTANDYPVYSVSVIGRKNRKGLTLLKFWQENLLYEFRSQHYGKIIWRNEGGRNRYISEICNRSGRLPFYREYASEIYAASVPENVLRQIRKFMEVLRDREYSYEHFKKRLPELIRCFEADDSCFSGETASFFRENLTLEETFSVRGTVGQLFFAAWYLTLLMLHALSGEQMQSPEMHKCRNAEELNLEALWKIYMKEREQAPKEVRWLTWGKEKRLGTPLPPHRFFGREQEMFDLRECLEKGGRYLLAGEEGVGKTELLCQILRFYLKEGLIDEAGIVLYEKNLKESFFRAFPGRSSGEREKEVDTILEQLKMREKRRVLLLIDNMESNVEDLELLDSLCGLSCVILAASREQSLHGFQTYQVPLPSRSAAKLIFRDNYEKMLSREDGNDLDEILALPLFRNTKTLCRLGQMAHEAGWTVRELKENLLKGEKRGVM